ncbi:hypothetical protein JI721_12500 [Alicyclobacillus cycloheptanicus]|uniref:Uncharacterized protein n=1 Tax=Alicyclobacillus cycloheptanicus TaxID=1457 RepID=A0ABT9XFC8_9BACL|nr:hypothetical protein [Alicyclobacillus cycloheptanicus]MDQ0188825.1 hypothetical protein [Alicyclobacillus cycloheptanicus]WDM00528.1 hypothetical protein JI721_12500 [Alicyclobacillus cycloheptanicus]
MSHRRRTKPILVCVGTIAENSGVYIADRNVVFGISSHSKSNNGFGRVDSHNLLYRNVNIVYDSDLIDTPIDDRDVKIYQNQTSASGSRETHVGFDSVNVATITNNSGIYVGDMKITGFDAHSKTNNGLGAISGNRNGEMKNLNYVYDSDVIDAPIHDQDIKLLSRDRR